ncbi:Fibroblast growth factor 21 [Varanus komodoensis]|uniref:Fibroblast growth factor n=1 Tax=Varanus komodoensis TaxID=61221 RepID=A0A8D2LIZ9_VARKO|nr:fibroblast growth factor 21-like [Varanus komodoensis]KAF7238867.1 Fibroblast growth factor 21 [Varanus komodoensis]
MSATTTPLRHKRCLLLLSSIIFWAALAPTVLAFPMQDSNPLYQYDGQVRLRHLYTADDQTHLYLQITADGTVSGSRYQNPFSLMEIKAVKMGIVVLKAKTTSLFLCMKPTGQLYSAISYREEACNFRETVLQDGYNVYFSESYNLPISLSSRRNLSPDQPLPPFSQFLPLVNRIPLEPEPVDYTFHRQTPDVESDDPFNLLGQQPDSMNPNYVSW